MYRHFQHIYVQTTCKMNFASDDPFNRLNYTVKEHTLNARVHWSTTSLHSVGVFCLVFGKILIMSNCTSLKQQLQYYRKTIYIAHPAPLSFWLICAKHFATLSKLLFNHQCNDASIYLTSTCLRRLKQILNRFIADFISC